MAGPRRARAQSTKRADCWDSDEDSDSDRSGSSRGSEAEKPNLELSNVGVNYDDELAQSAFYASSRRRSGNTASGSGFPSGTGQFSPTVRQFAAAYEYIFKVLLLGSAGVGKTHIVSRFVRDKVDEQGQSTIGVSFATRVMDIGGGSSVRLQLWDTAGKDEHKYGVRLEDRRSLYRYALIALLVYDVTSRKSFDDLNQWINDIGADTSKLAVMVLANKGNLSAAEHEVTREEGARWAEQQGCLFRQLDQDRQRDVEAAFRACVDEVLGRLALCEAPPQGGRRDSVCSSYDGDDDRRRRRGSGSAAGSDGGDGDGSSAPGTAAAGDGSDADGTPRSSGGGAGGAGAAARRRSVADASDGAADFGVFNKEFKVGKESSKCCCVAQ